MYKRDLRTSSTAVLDRPMSASRWSSSSRSCLYWYRRSHPSAIPASQASGLCHDHLRSGNETEAVLRLLVELPIVLPQDMFHLRNGAKQRLAAGAHRAVVNGPSDFCITPTFGAQVIVAVATDLTISVTRAWIILRPLCVWSLSMPRSPSIVPTGGDQDIYLVLDNFGHRLGRAWVETDEEDADLDTVLRHLSEGQYSNPVRIVSFNTAEGWSRDASDDVADELRQRCAHRGKVLLLSKSFSIGTTATIHSSCTCRSYSRACTHKSGTLMDLAMSALPPESGHCSIPSACLKGARFGSRTSCRINVEKRARYFDR
jgi:hypothetical protein